MIFGAILKRLDRIIELLELQTFIPEGTVTCEHRRTEDRGLMGDLPGSQVYCLDCGERVQGHE